MPTPAPVQFSTFDRTLIAITQTQYYFKPVPKVLLYSQIDDQRGSLVFRNGLLGQEYGDYTVGPGWFRLPTALESDDVLTARLFDRPAPTKLRLQTGGLTAFGATSLRLSPTSPTDTTGIPFMLFRNGLLQTAGLDYSTIGPWITLVVPIQSDDDFFALISMAGAPCSTFGGSISGTLNGSNRNFAFPSAPVQAMLFFNGLCLTEGFDYQRSGVNITVLLAPQADDVLSAQLYSGGGPPQVTTADNTLRYSISRRSILFRNGVMMTQPVDAITDGDNVTLSTTQLPVE